MTAWGRAKEGSFDAVYRPDGSVGAVALVIRDVHARKLAETRLDMLTKLSALVGMADFEDVAEALARVPIPAVRRLVRRELHRQQDGSRAPSSRTAIPPTRRCATRSCAPFRLGSAPAVAGDAARRLSAAVRGDRRPAAQAGGQRRAIPAARADARFVRSWSCRWCRGGRSPGSSPARTRRSRAVAMAATIRRWPRSWRCTPPRRSRTRA